MTMRIVLLLILLSFQVAEPNFRAKWTLEPCMLDRSDLNDLLEETEDQLEGARVLLNEIASLKEVSVEVKSKIAIELETWEERSYEERFQDDDRINRRYFGVYGVVK